MALRDWSRIPAFLAVADTGSLSAAAKRLGQSQPTLGRQIRALEEDLGVTLFTRQARGLVLTESGAALIEAARAMHVAAHQLSLTAAGREDGLSGTVRLTASRVVTCYVLPPVVAAIRKAEPAIQIELVPNDATDNLLFGEADIALRMFRPEQLDMVARHIGDLPLGLFASPDYLQGRTLPQTLEEALACDVIGYDREDRLIRGLRDYGIPAERSDFPVRCDDSVAHWELVRAGCGIAFVPVVLGQSDPNMVRLLAHLPTPVLPVWLTSHETMRKTPRVRRVWDLLAAGLKRVLAPPGPEARERRAGQLPAQPPQAESPSSGPV